MRAKWRQELSSVDDVCLTAESGGGGGMSQEKLLLKADLCLNFINRVGILRKTHQRGETETLLRLVGLICILYNELISHPTH